MRFPPIMNSVRLLLKPSGGCSGHRRKHGRNLFADILCTAQAHKEGGYEPNMTPLAPEAEPIILKTLESLADRVISDVFESFAPRLPVDNKDYTPSITIEKKEKK